MAEDRFDRESSQALKGVAIVLMLFHHCFRDASLYAGHVISFWPLQEQQVVNMAFASRICVSFFAFISGYGLFLSYQRIESQHSASCWCAKRYIKTFSGYWFVWILAAIICQLVDGRTGSILLQEGEWRCLMYGVFIRTL